MAQQRLREDKENSRSDGKGLRPEELALGRPDLGRRKSGAWTCMGTGEPEGAEDARVTISSGNQ